MNYLLQRFISKLKSHYYYTEIKHIGSLLGVLLLSWVLFTYSTSIAQTVFSHTGLVYASFLMLSIVLGQVIRLYYRIMVIKYAETK